MRFFETNSFEGDNTTVREKSRVTKYLPEAQPQLWAGPKIKTGDCTIQSPVSVMKAFYSAQNTNVKIWLPLPKSRTKRAEWPLADSRTFVPQFSCAWTSALAKPGGMELLLS